MKTPSKVPLKSPTLDMTPMIDVVFLLIIFFIVSSSLIRQETTMEIELPQAKTGVEPQQDNNKSQKLTINIPAAGQLLLGMNPITQSSLKEYLNKQSKTNDTIEVRIRVNKDVPYSEVVPILKDCAGNGIWNVAFPVVEE